MQFETREINNFYGMLQMPIPRGYEEQVNKLVDGIKNGKSVKVKLEIKRERRSLNANALLWKVLQDLAEYHQTSRWDLYKKYIEEYGCFEYLAILKDALPQLKSLFRVIKEHGTVKTADGVELVRVQCFWGSSKYDTKQFSLLLDHVLQDAKEIGFDYVSEHEKAIMMEAYEAERQAKLKINEEGMYGKDN